jgi:succinate-semialdehyde dehydrogenase/glutarate-semialdehyde dehydrogenase
MRRWYDLIMENASDIATIISWENGKAQADAKAEVTSAASFVEWFSEEAVRVYGDIIPHSVPSLRVAVFKQPVGVCGLITP